MASNAQSVAKTNGKTKPTQTPSKPLATGAKSATPAAPAKKTAAPAASAAGNKAGAASNGKGAKPELTKAQSSAAKAGTASVPRAAGNAAQGKEIAAAAPKVITKPKVSFVASFTEEMRRKVRDAYTATSRTIDAVDSEHKDKQKMGIQFSLPIVFTRGSRDNSSVLSAIVGDLSSMSGLVHGLEVMTDEETGLAYVEAILDIRNADQRKADEAAKIKLEDSVIERVEDVQNTVDEFKVIRRVAVRISSFSVLNLLNKSNNKEVKAGTFAVVNIEPRVWRDDSNRIAAITNLTGVQSHQKMPVDKFVRWMRSNGIYTKHFETKVAAYRREKLAYLKEHGAEPDKSTEAGFNYRKDNEMTVLLGFNHGEYLEQNLLMPAGCSFIDDSKRADGTFKYFDKKTNTNLARYQMSLLGEQWDAAEDEDPCYPFANKSRITRFQINIAFWTEFMELIDIYSVTAWKLLAPVNMPYLKAVAFLREKAADSNKNELNVLRLSELNGNDDDINSPAPPSALDIEVDEDDEEFASRPNRISFVIETNVDALLFDPVDFPRTVGLKVGADSVKRYVFDGKSTPKVLDDSKGSALEVNKPVICLSEIGTDAKRVLDNPNYEFRVITNIKGIDTDGAKFEQDMFGALEMPEAELTLAYLSSIVAKKQSTPLDAFLKTKKTTISNNHILRRFKFMIDGADPIFYVYAINLGSRVAIEEDFLSYVRNLKDADVSQFAPLLSDSPSAPPMIEGVSKNGPATESTDAIETDAQQEGEHAPQVEEVHGENEDEPMPDAPQEDEENEAQEEENDDGEAGTGGADPSVDAEADVTEAKPSNKTGQGNKRKLDDIDDSSVSERPKKKAHRDAAAAKSQVTSLADLKETDEKAPEEDPMEGVSTGQPEVEAAEEEEDPFA